MACIKSMCGLKLTEETYIVLGEHAEVLDLILQVSYTLHAHTESESGVLLRIYATGLKHVGIDHSATEDFNPSGVLAERATLASAEIT